jgi:hypothetical protein
MYARFIDTNTIEPLPKEYARADGTFVTNYNASGNNALWIADGFRFVEECPKPLGNYRPVYELLPDSIVQTWESFTPEVPTIQYSKRKLRLALAERGFGVSFTLFLASSDELTLAWSDSIMLESTDPLFIQAMNAFSIDNNISEETMADILAESIFDN